MALDARPGASRACRAVFLQPRPATCIYKESTNLDSTAEMVIIFVMHNDKIRL